MTFEQFVEHMRQEVREEGFMSSTKLAGRMVLRAKERELNVNPHEVLESLPCDDIHVIEYANSVTVEYRRKDLYYFNPDEIS